jgi:predicted RNase H-like HicB family nuclease
MESSQRTYTLSIEKHPDGYLAYFPALPGCNTWGKTYEDAVKYAEEALIGYLEAVQQVSAKQHIKEPPAKTSLGIVVEVPTIV